MGLIDQNVHPLNRRPGQCFQEAAQLIEGDKNFSLSDLWAMVACFQIAIRQILENQKRNPNKSLEQILKDNPGRPE